MQRFAHALRGIGHGLRTERNFRIHLAAAVLVFALAAWLELPAAEIAVLALTVGAVFAAELLNTAVENAVDLVTSDHHALAKRAKDTAAGSVLVTAIAAVVVGVCLFGPPLWERLAG